MARAKRQSDRLYNARRRYRRKAERLLRQAKETIGAAAERMRVLARDNIERALNTYQSGHEPSGKIAELAKSLGVRLKGKETPVDYTSSEQVEKVVQESLQTLENRKDTRDYEAKIILQRGNIGARFYGGLIDIWADADYADRDAAILDYFGADSLMDVLEELEQSGIDIYSSSASDEYYMNTALSIRNKILDNESS